MNTFFSFDLYQDECTMSCETTDIESDSYYNMCLGQMHIQTCLTNDRQHVFPYN